MRFRVIFCFLALLLAATVVAQDLGSGAGQSAPPATPQPSRAGQPSAPAMPPATKAPSLQSPSQQSTGASALPPASSSGTSSDDVTTFRRTVNEVNVVFTVTDRHGHYIRDLRRGDFTIFDDGKPPSEVRSFQHETDLPLQVGLLIDASNSVRDRFKFEQQSATVFLNQTIRPRYDKAFVVGFDVTPEVTQDFTDSTEALSRGIQSLLPGGGTAMYDALYFACRDKLLKAPQAGPVRKAIILLSDGDDNQSHVTREESIDMAERAGVIVYTISTNIMGGNQRGDKVLARIADATGGRAFFPVQISDVATSFARIQDELRSQYAFSYKPADFLPNGKYRTIQIVARNHKDFRVRSRKGYYAPAE